MSEFKVGDRVICNTDWGYGHKNDEAIVVEIDCSGNYYNARVKYTSGIYKGFNLYVHEKYYDLLTEDDKPKFKIGNEIRALRDLDIPSGWGTSIEEDDIVEVIEYDDGSFINKQNNIKSDIMVKTEDTKYWVNSKDFEPVEVKQEQPIKLYSKYEQKAIDKIRKLFKEKK